MATLSQPEKSWGFPSIRYISRVQTAFCLAAAMMLAACSGAPDHSGLEEASTGFDAPDVQPFLMRLAPLFEGFGTAEIDPLVDEALSLPLNATRAYAFEVAYEGESVPLQIEVFMDDVEALDVSFFGTADVIAVINREMDAFFEERGY